MLTKAMAAEWGAHGIQANAIGPGYMLTDMNEALIANPEFDAWVKGRTPARRWGEPEELAGTAVFLASPASNYVNGQIIYVDGGMISSPLNRKLLHARRHHPCPEGFPHRAGGDRAARPGRGPCRGSGRRHLRLGSALLQSRRHGRDPHPRADGAWPRDSGHGRRGRRRRWRA